MLKFTAELSDEFRRASSLSSLQAYHRTKSASNQIKTHSNWFPNHKSGMEQLKKMTIAHPNSNLSICRKNRADHQKSHQLNPNCKMHKTTQSFCSKRGHPDIANYMTCPSRQVQPKTVSNFYQSYGTPAKKETINQQTKLRNTCSTSSSNKIQQNNELSQDNMVIRVLQPKNSLNNLNQNHIKIQQCSFKKQRQNKQSINDENAVASPTFRCSSIFKQNINNPIKMRITSINTLQNIQKRIQATLGNHRTLKI